jgi:hypothetical protein
MKEMTEFYCHWCNGYIRIALDFEFDGNHVIICPKCKHEHCRVIKDGKVTSDRWQSRNQTFTYRVTTANYFLASASDSNANVFISQAWLNTTAT